jgi:hypothetical protein
MARFLASVICALVVLTGTRADEPLEKRCQAVLDELAKIQKTLDSVKDKATATAAMKALETTKWIPHYIENKADVLTPKQVKWLKDEFVPASKRAREMVILTTKRILADDEMRDQVCAKTDFGKVMIEALNEETTAKGKNIRQALMAYFLRSGGDSWPTNLKQLASPDDGSRAYLEGGIDALMNGWGKPFDFRIVDDPKTGPKPVVTTSVPFPKKWTEIEIK